MSEEHVQTPAELAAALKAVTATSPDEPASFTIYPHEEFDLQSMGFVSLDDALAALVAPHDFVAFEYQGSPRMYVSTKGQDTPNGSFVLLTLAYETDYKLDLAASYRLYGSESELATFAADARAAFQGLLQRYGLPFGSGKGRALFLPVLKVKGVATDEGWSGEWDLGLPEWETGLPLGRWRLNGYSGMPKDDPDGGKTATMYWVFAVDAVRYDGEMKAHRD
jgi:hypothetical protein